MANIHRPKTGRDTRNHQGQLTTKLREAIETCGVPVLAVAKMAGIHPSTVYSFMDGNSSLSLIYADRLAAVVGLTLEKTGELTEVLQPMIKPIRLIPKKDRKKPEGPHVSEKKKRLPKMNHLLHRTPEASKDPDEFFEKALSEEDQEDLPSDDDTMTTV